MFDKMTSFKILSDGIEILDGELIKTAALKLPDGIEYDPDFFYCKVRAVSAGEYWGCNKNFDYFPEEELKKSYKTFLNAHVFKNHENKDVANSIGDVLDATWDDNMKCVILLIRIDRRLAPSIVRGFEKGFTTDVSMGCRIAYSVCSVCGKKAKTKFDYCDHIKFMRGKILNNGKKVCEINIGTKFHDISAVLNGAEKSAKIQNMLVEEKTAFEHSGMEKAASFEDSFNMDFETEQGAEKSAYENIQIFEEKKASKKDNIQKVAEIKKEIQGKIISVAKGELLNDNANKIESVAKLIKLLYTDYFDKEKCDEIASQLKEIAIQKQMPLEVIFHQFLKVLDFAGIDLTPLELHDIYHSLIERDTPDLRVLQNKIPVPSNLETFMDSLENIQDEHAFNHAINMPTMFNTIQHNVEPNINRVHDITDNPVNKLKAVIIKVKMPTPEIADDLAYNDIMSNIVKNLMPSRSAHRRFIIRRFEGLDKKEPNFNNLAHFAPTQLLGAKTIMPKMIPFLLSALMHANYERERVAHFNSEDMEYGLSKFASYIEGESMDNILNEFAVEKMAANKNYTTRKAIMVGIPATYAYSALQRARINNGDNVNNFNRYVAENPGNAAVVQLIVGPKASKILKRKATGANEVLLNKYASEDNFFERIYKEASALENENIYNKDMFKDAEIDNALKEVYNDNQVNALKQACILNFMDREDLADEVLSKVALDESHLSEYLKIAKDSIKIEIEKNASQMSELAKQTMVGTMFHKPGKSVVALLPGLALDTAAFLWLDKKMLGKEPKK